MKVGDLVKFRMFSGTEDDWSAPTLVVAKFDGISHLGFEDELFVGICRGIRCLIDKEKFEWEIISES